LFRWRSREGEDDNPVVLRGLRADIPVGRLTVIAGPVGSGKSVSLWCGLWRSVGYLLSVVRER
jgi:ABC-type transporter Mla maintaining outer membrane lipid asymmetry ATPase subunit MlaF